MPQSLPPTPKPKRDTLRRTFSENVTGYLTMLPDRLSVFGKFLTGKQRPKSNPLDDSLDLEDLALESNEAENPADDQVTQYSHQTKRPDGEKGCGKCITCINGRECLKEVAFEGCGRCLCCFNNRRCLQLEPLPGHQDGCKSYSKYMEPTATLDDVVAFEPQSSTDARFQRQSQVDHEAINEWLKSVNIALANNITEPRWRTVKAESSVANDPTERQLSRMLPQGLKNLKVKTKRLSQHSPTRIEPTKSTERPRVLQPQAQVPRQHSHSRYLDLEVSPTR